MTPDEVNRAAILGILGMALVVGLIYVANWALGEDRAPVLVAGATVQTVAVGEPPTDSTATDEASTATSVAVTALDSATDSASTPPPTTTSIPGTTTSPATTTTVPATTTTTGSTVTTSTTMRIPPDTTTTTVKPTTTTVKPTTTTTVRPTTTTTSSTTTTTLPPTTTTTTTTLPPTTTTTVPPTTTTTIPLPGLLVHKFEGHDHGEAGEWEAHINIEIRDENDDRAPFASVRVAWGGSAAGSEWLGSDKDGKIDTRLGLFADASITFRITNVTLAGFVYQPTLNEVSSSLLIVGPN